VVYAYTEKWLIKTKGDNKLSPFLLNNHMRLYEFHENYLTGWLNINTGELINHSHNVSHVHAVLSNPGKYNVSYEELNSLIDMNKVKHWMLDGNTEIVTYMAKHGWVRVIHDDKQLNIQATTVSEVRKAASILSKKYNFDEIYFDVLGKDGTFIMNDNINAFIKYGTIL